MPFFGNHTAPHKTYSKEELENYDDSQETKGNVDNKDQPFGPPASKEELEKSVIQTPNVTP